MIEEPSCATTRYQFGSSPNRGSDRAQGPLVGQPVLSLPNRGHREAHNAWVASLTPPPWERPGSAAPQDNPSSVPSDPESTRGHSAWPAPKHFWFLVSVAFLVTILVGATLGEILGAM